MGTGLTQDWLTVSGDDAVDQPEPGEVVRITLDISAEDAALLKRLALYRNAKAAVEKKRLKRQWSAKSLAEDFIDAACKAQRAAMTEVVAALGALPDEKESMAAYAARAVRFESKK